MKSGKLRHEFSGSSGSSTICGRLAPAVFACMVTLMSASSYAQDSSGELSVEIPPLPMQSGAKYPAPNIMFILDDSGSMEFDFMPGANYSSEVPKTSPQQIQLETYARNTLYYNPNTNYLPWLKADGSRYTDGTDYDDVFTSDTQLSGSADLSKSTRTFYVPKADATDLSDSRQYVRYTIRKSGGTVRVTRPSSSIQGQWPDIDIGTRDWRYESFTVPPGTEALVVTAQNGSGGDVDLYVRRGNKPTQYQYDAVSWSSGNEESITINDPASGTWWVGAFNYSNNRKVNNEDIVAAVSELIEATPTGRSQEAEIRNFATWYSYYRTRSKMAKGAASEAFGQIGTNVRVGFDTIWNRNPYDIPVNTDDGRFVGTNRSTWFERLHKAIANGGTPLKGALYRAGEYYQRDSASGPWGPEAKGDQMTCRQSFAILTTDGYWNSNSGYPSNDRVGDSDSNDGKVHTSGDGKKTLGYKAVPPYSDENGHKNSDSYSNTLADIANYYWKNDLRDDLDNNVPTSAADPAFWQHMTTFGLAIGQSGTLDPDTDLPSIINGTKYWPEPDDDDPETIDDLWHAAVNGHGSFVAATSPEEFVQGLLDALSTVAERLGSASNVTANSTSLETDTRLYQASYVSGRWTGELQAFDVSGAGISATPEWRASEQMPDAKDRDIWTFNGTKGVDFITTVSGNTALRRTTGSAIVSSADNAAYIAGERSEETINGGVLRTRSSVLGDIVNSSPYFVDSTKTIFVGANDGMLHAFAATSRGSGANRVEGGEELFGYVPAGVDLSVLAQLSDPNYRNEHRWFVDGPVVVSTSKQTPGKSYLVGAMGRGGKGVFGLDVSNPDSFGANDVLWDKTFAVGGTAPSKFGNMGQVLGDPLIVTLNNGKKAVLVGNGINSGNGTTTATASLFIIDITDGSVIKEIDTGVAGGNGLSAPRGADLNIDGKVDYVYAGDLKGNVWKFDLSGSSDVDWEVANSGSPMFKATDSDGKAQPITAGLALARDAESRVWVFVGTGSYMTSEDASNRDTQSLYGLMDLGTAVTRSDLQEQHIVAIELVNGRKIRAFEKHNDTLSTGKKGWVIDFDEPSGTGERVVSNPRVDGLVLAATSIVPPDNALGCQAGGTGFVNAVDAFTGTATSQPYFDSNGDGKVDENDVLVVDGEKIPAGSLGTGAMPSHLVRVGNRYYYGLSDGSSDDEVFNPQGAMARRTSWREVLED